MLFTALALMSARSSSAVSSATIVAGSSMSACRLRAFSMTAARCRSPYLTFLTWLQ